jgi:glycosyltransferase involved in cell wall biosynthesis
MQATPMPAGTARTPSICFVSSEHPPYDKRVYEGEARSLAAAGYRVFHLCPDKSPADRPAGEVQIVQYPHRRGKWRRLLGLPDLYKRARRLDADAYHCNEPDSWLVGVALRLLAGRLVVFDCHEYYAGQVMRWLPFGTRHLGAWAIRVYLQIMALATHLIVLAKYSVADDFSLSRDRTLVILNTSPLKVLDSRASDTAPAPPPDPAGEFRFVHTGVISRERGSDQLLDALGILAGQGLQHVRLVIVGEFTDGSQQDFFGRAETMGLRERIEFHRWMPYEQAFALVQRSHAGLVLFQSSVLNNVAGMPHKMFDYMLAGIPVIAPEFAPDIVRVIEDAQCGLLIDTADAVVLARAMRALIDDKSLRETLGRRGQEAVRRTYNWEADARKLAEAYRQLFAQHGKPHSRAAA